jgi:hypothetical protein
MSDQAGLEYVLRRLHHDESRLATQLREIADRHRADHEIHHVAHDLAAWSDIHVAQVAALAAGHGLDLDRQADQPGPVRHLGQALSTLVGRRPEAGLLLLEDLRTAYLMASEASLSWELLAQLAQAGKYPELLELSSTCHPKTLRQIRWANTMLKTLSPQVLTSL